MAYSRFEPFSSVDIPDDEWNANVAAWRRAQDRFEPVAAERPRLDPGFPLGSGDPTLALRSAEMPHQAWQIARAQQLAGSTAAPPHRLPLTGRPGPAAIVANTLNTIAGSPNSSGPLPPASIGGVSVGGGRVTRGRGDTMHGEGRIGIPPFGKRIGADGTLDPPNGRPEVAISGIRGRGLDLPPRIRVFTTPTGELDVDMAGPFGWGPFRRDAGTYVIGTPDPPKRTR
jgi:hypothetical protein